MWLDFLGLLSLFTPIAILLLAQILVGLVMLCMGIESGNILLPIVMKVSRLDRFVGLLGSCAWIRLFLSLFYSDSLARASCNTEKI